MLKSHLVRILFACLAAAMTARVADAAEQAPTQEVTIVSVGLSGRKNHVHDWMAVVRVQESETKQATLRLFMHSPVLKFGVAAESLPGKSFRIKVREQRDDSIFRFDVVEER